MACAVAFFVALIADLSGTLSPQFCMVLQRRTQSSLSVLAPRSTCITGIQAPYPSKPSIGKKRMQGTQQQSELQRQLSHPWPGKMQLKPQLLAKEAEGLEAETLSSLVRPTQRVDSAQRPDVGFGQATLASGRRRQSVSHSHRDACRKSLELWQL